MIKKKFKRGLVIGRFQPFHLGHKFLIEEALKIADKIIIGIGSANKNDDKNPWDWLERKKFIEEFVSHAGLTDKVINIIPLFDNPDDDVWFEDLKKSAGKFDVTIGNNPWNNGIIERHGIKAVEVGFKNREEWEGVQIRSLMKKNKEWKSRVPSYLADKINLK